MVSWWILIAIIIIFVIFKYFSNNKLVRRILENIISFLAVFQLIILLVALITKDPLFEAIGLPKEYEWIGGLFVSLFLLWQFYLSPLKERVIETEKDMREIKVNVRYIKEVIDRKNKF